MAGRPENGVSQIGNDGGNGHLVPVLLMLSAVMIWAIVPLAIDLSAGSLNPFLFGGGWRLGGAIGCGLFLLFRYPKLLGTLWFMVSGSERIGEADTREVVRRHFSLRGLGGWSLVYSAFGKFDYTLFAIAAQSVAISIVAVVFEIWPIVMIILMGVFFQRRPAIQENRCRVVLPALPVFRRHHVRYAVRISGPLQRGLATCRHRVGGFGGTGRRIENRGSLQMGQRSRKTVVQPYHYW